MLSLVQQTVRTMLQETALDMTRAGQMLAGLPLTRPPVPFLSANLQYPQPDPSATVNTTAVLSGHVRVRRNASIGARVVLRGDTALVDVGRQTQVGDETLVLATSRQTDNPFSMACIVGHDCMIGSRVVLTSCKVEDKVTIGDDCKVGDGAIIEAGVVLEPGTVIPAGRLVPKETRWSGNPAKFLGAVKDDHH